jgi:hypothetical protein
MMVASLLVAGTDTTRNQLAASMQVLFDHPEQWAMLRDRPELAMAAVEESMRHSPAVCSTLRTVNEDAELGGYTFPRGTFIFVNTFAANCDPAVYDDPDRLDITRDAPPAILTFGGGVHYCLGANLARLELAEALKILAVRIPNPRRVGTLEAAAWHERPNEPEGGVRHPIRLRDVRTSVARRKRWVVFKGKFEHVDFTRTAVDLDERTRRQRPGSPLHIHHTGETELAGHHGRMRHRAPQLGHHRSGITERRGVSDVGDLCDQDLAGL